MSGEMMRLRKRSLFGMAGWIVAAALAVALVVVTLTAEQRLSVLAEENRGALAVADRRLSICEAEKNTLTAALEVLDGGRSVGAGPMDTADLLSRQARGVDACARALEAEALVREALR